MRGGAQGYVQQLRERNERVDTISEVRDGRIRAGKGSGRTWEATGSREDRTDVSEAVVAAH